MARRLGGKRLERVNGRLVEVPDIGPRPPQRRPRDGNVPHINASFCVCDRCRPDLAAADERREAVRVTEATAPSRAPSEETT